MSENVIKAQTDTSDMVRVHRVFREAFGAAAPLIGSVAPDDSERAEIVGTYYDNMLAFLHSHHEGEDELVWPKLLDRCPAEADTVTRVARQHEGVLASLEIAEKRLAEWRADPQVESGAVLAAALATLGAELTVHLDDEERLVLPIASAHMSPEEWGELPSHGMAHFRGDKIWLVVGLLQEQMTPEMVEQMEAHMPPPVHEFWVSTGRPQFQAFIAELRG